MWIHPQFVSDGSLRSVTAPYRCVGGQLTDYLLEGMSHGCIIATFEIGSANTHLEQGVTREGHLLFLVVLKKN